MKLTDEAKGRECQVRITGVCNGDPATTVPAHLPMAGTSGMGMKCPNTCIAWACSDCHDALDGRTEPFWPPQFAATQLPIYAFDGLRRTLKILHDEGYRLVKL